MSGAISLANLTSLMSISGQAYGSLTPVVQNTELTAQQLDTLTEQASSGLISQTYSGLSASAAATVLSVSPQISAANAQISEINAATGPMTVQQNALSEIGSITSGIVAQLTGLGTLDPDSASSVISAAKSALQSVASLLDTQDGGTYVFGGQDSGEAPVPDPQDITGSSYYSQIAYAVSNLSSIGAAATTANILYIAGSNAAGSTPFAAGLTPSPGLPSVTLANGQQVTTGIAANSNAFVTSTGTGTGTGTTSTGSYMRDILAGLASIAALSTSQVSASDFSTFITSTSAMLQNAGVALNEDAGVLGNSQTQLTTQSTNLTSTVTALTNQVSNADSVDTAATLSQLSAVQTALESSYQIIAGMKTLNLAYYL